MRHKLFYPLTGPSFAVPHNPLPRQARPSLSATSTRWTQHDTLFRLPTFLPHCISDHCIPNPNPNPNTNTNPDPNPKFLVKNILFVQWSEMQRGRKGGHHIFNSRKSFVLMIMMFSLETFRI